MDFFRRFKRGDFGRFYGSVDPMVITCALRDYMQERAKILDRIAREDREAARVSDPAAADYHRKYEHRKKILRFYYRNFSESDISLMEFEPIYWLFRLGDDIQNKNFIYEKTGL